MRKLVLFLALMIATSALFAQVTTSSISGNVSDDNGQPLVGATIKAVHTPTGTIYLISTQKNGSYNIGGMRVGGPYTLEASYVGYNTAEQKGVMLTLGEDGRFDFKLNESTMAMSEIVVTGKANPVFNSNRTGAQSVITNEMMSKLPTINRSLNDFTRLTPMSSGNSFGGTSHRFNNVTVDGASFNNSFGLSSSLGANGTEPISLEALDQVQVMIAPYDVRNGAFTGAGINSVTKSGTNDWQASLYYYMKHPDLVGYKQNTLDLPWSDFNNNQVGFTLGGPIIKNKLFLFVNGEMDRQDRPINYQPRPNKNTPQQPGESIVDMETQQTLVNFLQDKFNYNPGDYNVKNSDTRADRITARLDWNINSKNTMSVKYFYLKSFNTNPPSSSGSSTSRGASANTIPFSSVYYRTNNNFNIVMADLNTTINERMSNTLKVGYSALRDYREMDGGFFPMVDINNGQKWAGETGYVASTNISTTFGTENNSYNNMLDSDIFQIQDNFTLHAGKHQLTFGTQSDYRKFVNGYGRSYAGEWVYNSYDAFYEDVIRYKNYVDGGMVGPYSSLATRFTKQYSLLEDGSFPYAEVKVLSLGFYVQDKWTVHPNFNLTLGLRVDTPIFLNDAMRNIPLEEETFQGGVKIDVSKFPKTAPLFSPRLGFNWDVLGNRALQLRGGTGLFSGTPPYVWLSNQAGNNGLLFGKIDNITALKGMNGGFTGDVNFAPSDRSTQKSDIAFSDPNFKYPQLWKTNIAADMRLGSGWTGTVEMLYNKDVNAIYHVNVALPEANSADAFEMVGADKRTVYKKTSTSNLASSAVMMKNTSKGYSIYTTFQLQKEVLYGALRGLTVGGSYTVGKSMGVTDGTSSVASSAWRYRQAVDPNSQELGFTAGSFPSRLLISGSYRKEFKNTASSLGFVFQRYMPYRFSYTYSGDVNGDGEATNDLIFVPETKDQIRIVPESGDTRSEEEIWRQIDNFIANDPYLSTRRGKYSERNGGVVPFVNRLDVNFTQDFFVKMKNGKRNTVRLSLDIANFGNLLNKNWGVQKSILFGDMGRPQMQFLKMTNKPTETTAPGFTMQYMPKGDARESTSSTINSAFKDYISSSSRWSIQFGVKYMFN